MSKFVVTNFLRRVGCESRKRVICQCTWVYGKHLFLDFHSLFYEAFKTRKRKHLSFSCSRVSCIDGSPEFKCDRRRST